MKAAAGRREGKNKKRKQSKKRIKTKPSIVSSAPSRKESSSPGTLLPAVEVKMEGIGTLGGGRGRREEGGGEAVPWRCVMEGCG